MLTAPTIALAKGLLDGRKFETVCPTFIASDNRSKACSMARKDRDYQIPESQGLLDGFEFETQSGQ